MAEPKTESATYENFDELFPAQAREEFWMLVRKTLVEVFKTDPQVADSYRQKIEGSGDSWSDVIGGEAFEALPGVSGKEGAAKPGPSAGERIAVYHTSALSIAADLAGWREPIPDEKLRAFLKLQHSYAKKLGVDLELAPNGLRD
jgi:hypothetical protein